MQKNPVGGIFGLFATYNKLPIFDCDGQILIGETGDRKRDPEGVIRDLLDIVGGISILGLSCPFDQPFELIEPKKKWVCSQR